ncbi:MAG: ATP-grasp domain-containing protein [Nitrospirae bacterium]|nr:ATP-grasp domain-containing protein [Nitrospirota bacterium]
MAKVFVTDGYWHKTLSVVRSLGEKGIDVAVGESTRLATALFSRYARRRVIYPSPKTRPEEFLNFLEDELKKERYDVLIIPEESTLHLIAKNIVRFDKLTRFPFPDYNTILKASDKKEVLKAAIDIGIPVPETVFIDDIAELEDKTAGITFPVVIKPRVSSGSYGIRYVNNMKELITAYKEVHEKYPLPLIQEYIPQGGDAFGVSALFDRNIEPKAVFVHKRLREYPITGGPSTLRESVVNDEVQELGIKLLKALKWYGVAMVEFKIDPRDNRPKLMEINPRFWGSLSLSVYAGVDFPYLLYKMAMGEAFKPVTTYKTGLRSRYLLPGDIMHFFSNPERFKMRPGFFNFFDKKTRDDIISIKDPLPTIGRILSLFTLLYHKDMRRYLKERN